MRIVHVLESLMMGGQEQMVNRLAQVQMSYGDNVAVICLCNQGELAEELKDKGIAVFNCQLNTIPKLQAIKQLKKYLTDLKPDVIHTHNPVSNYYTIVAKPYGCQAIIVNTRHGMGVGNEVFRNFYYFKRECIFKLSTFLSTYTVTVCLAAKQQFIRSKILSDRKTHVIYNGIHIDKSVTSSLVHRNKLREQLNISSDSYIIGTVGRLDYLKNQALLLQAFSQIIHHIPDAILVFVGSGDPKIESQLKLLAAKLDITKHTKFMGNQSNVNELLPGFDVFVLPSLTEGYSMALLEACASKLPIIATDVGGNSEIIKHEKTGLLIKSGDVNACSESLIRLYHDPELSQQLARNARAWVEQHGTIEETARKYEELYQRKR